MDRKRARPFSVDFFVDVEQASSSMRWLEVALFDSAPGARVPEDVEDNSLHIWRLNDARERLYALTGSGNHEDLLWVKDVEYSGGKATFRAAVKEPEIPKKGFFARIAKPRLYEIEARTEADGAAGHSVTRVMKVNIRPTSVHWRWWEIKRGDVGTGHARLSGPHADTPILLSPDGESGFELETWIERYDPDTGKHDPVVDQHDFTHWLAPNTPELTLDDIEIDPLPWEATEPTQKTTYWFSKRPLEDSKPEIVVRVDAYPKNSISERIATPPHVKASKPKEARRDISIFLEKLELEVEPSEPFELSERNVNDGVEVKLKVTRVKKSGPEPRKHLEISWKAVGDEGQPVRGRTDTSHGSTGDSGTATFRFYPPARYDTKQPTAQRFEAFRGTDPEKGVKLGEFQLAWMPAFRFRKKPWFTEESGAPLAVPFDETQRSRIQQLSRTGGTLYIKFDPYLELKDEKIQGEEPVRYVEWFLDPQETATEDLEGRYVTDRGYPFEFPPPTKAGEDQPTPLSNLPEEEITVEISPGGLEESLDSIVTRAKELNRALRIPGEGLTATAHALGSAVLDQVSARPVDELTRRKAELLDFLSSVPQFLDHIAASLITFKKSLHLHGEAYHRFWAAGVALILEFLFFLPDKEARDLLWQSIRHPIRTRVGLRLIRDKYKRLALARPIIETAEQTVETFQKEHDRLARLVKEAEQEWERAAAEASEALQKNVDSATKLHDHDRLLEAATRELDELDALRGGLSELQRVAREAETAFQAAKGRLEAFAELELKANGLDTAIGAATRSVDEAKLAIGKAEGEVTRLRGLQAEAEAAATRVVEDQLEPAKKALIRAGNQHQKAADAVLDNIKEIRALPDEAQEAAMQAHRLLVKTEQRLAGEEVAKREALDRVTKEIRRHSSEASRLGDEITKLGDEIQDSRDGIRELQRQAKDDGIELETLRTRIEGQQAEVASLREGLSDLESEASDAAGKVSQANERLEGYGEASEAARRLRNDAHPLRRANERATERFLRQAAARNERWPPFRDLTGQQGTLGRWVEEAKRVKNVAETATTVDSVRRMERGLLKDRRVFKEVDEEYYQQLAQRLQTYVDRVREADEALFREIGDPTLWESLKDLTVKMVEPVEPSVVELSKGKVGSMLEESQDAMHEFQAAVVRRPAPPPGPWLLRPVFDLTDWTVDTAKWMGKGALSLLWSGGAWIADQLPEEGYLSYIAEGFVWFKNHVVLATFFWLIGKFAIIVNFWGDTFIELSHGQGIFYPVKAVQWFKSFIDAGGDRAKQFLIDHAACPETFFDVDQERLAGVARGIHADAIVSEFQPGTPRTQVYIALQQKFTGGYGDYHEAQWNSALTIGMNLAQMALSPSWLKQDRFPGGFDKSTAKKDLGEITERLDLYEDAFKVVHDTRTPTSGLRTLCSKIGFDFSSLTSQHVEYVADCIGFIVGWSLRIGGLIFMGGGILVAASGLGAPLGAGLTAAGATAFVVSGVTDIFFATVRVLIIMIFTMQDITVQMHDSIITGGVGYLDTYGDAPEGT